jgi:molybdenum cofactor cytidylyltransferase
MWESCSIAVSHNRHRCSIVLDITAEGAVMCYYSTPSAPADKGTSAQERRGAVRADQSCAAILLAAGTSSRMGAGRHKLLLPLAGRPLIVHTVEAALHSQARPLLIVLGHLADELRAALGAYGAHPAIETIVNPAYPEGMSTSLRAGLRALLSRPPEQRPGAALILLGDQPFVSAALLDRLIEAWRATGRPIVAPLYQGRRGNPVLFAATLFAELLTVEGDEGGRRVVEQHRSELLLVEVTEQLAQHDVDTWEAYQEALRAWQAEQEH